EFWKLKQEEKLMKKAKILVTKNFTEKNLKEILDGLFKFYSSYSQEISKNSNPFLLSSLSYHKSILSSAYRSISNNSECDCSVHPAFLIGKTNFNCQEEQFIKIDTLRKILKKLC
ncbi:MAG: hypothetical protein ACWIPI_10265, partial [Polaribacter sp.]